MAENVAVTTIEIRGTEKVATSMKELKQQISDYRDKLVVLGQAEEETEEIQAAKVDTIEKLRKATKLLSDATNAHKQSVAQEQKAIDVQKDSYNDLQREMSRLKKEYKDMVSQERDSPMGEETLRQIQELDVKLKELDAGMGQFQRNVGNYGQTFEESMAQAKQNAGFLQQGLGSLAGVMGLVGVENQGLIKGVGLASIAMQVFANEGVQKLIIKLKDKITAMVAAKAADKAAAAETKAMSAAMATEAVATNTATTATNLFKKALIATGIGAIVVLIGTLIANLDTLAEMFSFSGEEAEKSFEEAKEELEKLEKQMEQNIEMLQALGATQAEVFSAQIHDLTTLVDKYNELVDIEVDKWFNDYEAAAEAAREKQEELNDKLHDAKVYLTGIMAESTIAFNERNLNDYHKSANKINREFEYMYKLAGEIMENGGMSGPQLQKTLENLRAWKDQQLQMLEEEWDEKDKIEDERLAAQAAAAAKKREEERKKKAEAESAAWQKQMEQWAKEDEAAAAQDEQFFEQELERMEEADAAKEEFFKKDLARMEEEKQQLEEEAAFKKQLDEEEQTRVKETIEKRKAAASAGAAAVAGLLNTISDIIESNEENEEEAMKKTKGLKIAATTIETITGATTALATAMTLGPIAGPIVGGINAAAIVASGVANIAKLNAVPTNGTTSASPSSASASVSAPNINTQLESVRNITTASEEERLNQMANPQKVYILQSDIEAASNASKAIVNESSF